MFGCHTIPTNLAKDQTYLTPWQFGGVSGPDCGFLFLAEVLHLRRKKCCEEMAIAFLDGQSAFCRPPRLQVIAALFQVQGLNQGDILVINVILSGLSSRAAIGGIHGHWRNEVGLPQGGSLSVALFDLLTLQLHQRLLDMEAGAQAPLAGGCFTVPAAGYVDDILLLGKDNDVLQKPLSCAKEWQVVFA